MSTRLNCSQPRPDSICLMADAVRMLAAETVERAGSGHPGLPLGMADAVTALFSGFLKFDSDNPDWPDRDRFVLSAGHGSALLYAILYLCGYPGMSLDQLKRFRQWGSLTPGHPEYHQTSGVEATTGPLGQGLANAVGMALAERILNARFGDDLVDHHTYAVVSDGDLMEGVANEAISVAGHLKLRRLVVLWDDNHITIDGDTALTRSENVLERLAANHWRTLRVENGNDPVAVSKALAQIHSYDQPLFIACRTIIGYGAPGKAGQTSAHGEPLGRAVLDGLRQSLNWKHAPFHVPEDILANWRLAGQRGKSQRLEWEDRLAAAPQEQQDEFKRRIEGTLPNGWAQLLKEYKLHPPRSPMPTRKASEEVLERLTKSIPELVGGSADLGRSTLTQIKSTQPIQPEQYQGRYIHYGVREFAMASIMNGLALHRGTIPYGGTFLVFSDYMRNAIRMAAMMRLRVIFIFTHDSIALGEDGPTHQPIEHLAMLRATPNLWTFRPADAVETAESWSLALSRCDGPSALVLSRQPIIPVRTAEQNGVSISSPNGIGEQGHSDDGQREANLCARGAYVLKEADGQRQVTLIATGSEVTIACQAQALLAQADVAAAVVSMPCWECFERQSREYQIEVLRPELPRVAIEAASPMGWASYVGENGLVIGMSGFGASAPGTELLEHFGFTPEVVAAKVKDHLSQPNQQHRSGCSV